MLEARHLPSHLMFLGGINGTSATPTVVPDASTGAVREQPVRRGQEGKKMGNEGERSKRTVGEEERTGRRTYEARSSAREAVRVHVIRIFNA